MLVEAEISDELLEGLPNRAAVFLLWAREGKPFLARTNVLRRRVMRLLNAGLRQTIVRVEYQFTGSRLEAQFLMWELARQHLGPDYARQTRLRFPPYVKLVMSNPYPRTRITAQLGRSPGVCFGPFRDRSTAALFESEFLDLFQLRRCQEDLNPSPEHPGCMYGEMGRCLRPCQTAVGPEEYRGEADRVAEFLHTGGKSLLDPALAARDRLSVEMDFEGAAMMHQRLQKIEAAVQLRDEMARDVNVLNAVAIVPSSEEGAVELGWMRGGYWQGFTRLEFSLGDANAVSLDSRIRQACEAAPARQVDSLERMEQLAILSRWFYSTWRDGEMLLIDDWQKAPYRKLVNAVSRVANRRPTPHPSNRS